MLHKMIVFLSWMLMGLTVPGAVWAQGAVYAMTNALGYKANEIIVYQRAANGSLTYMQTISTGGGGSGIQLADTDPLGSQGGLMLDPLHRYLFAVNTETLNTNASDCQEGTITAFRIAPDGSLTFAHRVLSGGFYPVSLTVRAADAILYVLNAGGPGNPVCGTGANITLPRITGFTITSEGLLIPLEDSTQLIGPGPNPGVPNSLNCDPGGFPADGSFDCGLNPPAFVRSASQVGFTPDSERLVVTVKGTNELYVFPVNKAGQAGLPTITQAPGPNQPSYFGFAFDKAGHLIVAEPFGNTATIPDGNASAASSFTINPDGSVEPISSSVLNLGGTSCWVTVDPVSNQFAYVSNNASNDISSYSIEADGSLELIAAIAATANGPNDMAVAHNFGRSFLYVLNSGNGTVGAFKIGSKASLEVLGEYNGLPQQLGAQGLAAY